MKISVTQVHIDHGHAGDCETCPVALAILAAIPVRSCSIYVSGIEVKFVFSRQRIVVSLPYEATTFVLNFDNRRKVKPFDFELPITEAELNIVKAGYRESSN